MNEIIEKCLKQLNSIDFRPDIQVGHDKTLDFLLSLTPDIVMIGEVKKRIESRVRAMDVVAQLRRQQLNRRGELMLFCEWISPNAAEEMRAAGVNYVDTCGNIYIKVSPHILISVQGTRPADSASRTARISGIGGLKVIHQILQDPKLVNAPLRMMAKQSSVSLGTAHIVIAELEKKGWLLPRSNGRKIGDWEALFDTFVKGYGLKLRPALYIGKYRHYIRDPEEMIGSLGRRLEDAGCKWALAGGMAAKRRTLYLAPDEVSLFVDDAGAETLKREKMSLDEREGNLTLFRLYSDSIIDKTTFVDSPWPIATLFLIYAELMYDGRPRELETAKMIYEQIIEQRRPHG